MCVYGWVGGCGGGARTLRRNWGLLVKEAEVTPPPTPDVSIRQHTSAYVRHASAYVRHTSAYVCIHQHTSGIRQAYVRIRQPTSDIRQAYVSIRQHTSDEGGGGGTATHTCLPLALRALHELALLALRMLTCADVCLYLLFYLLYLPATCPARAARTARGGMSGG